LTLNVSKVAPVGASTFRVTRETDLVAGSLESSPVSTTKSNLREIEVTTDSVTITFDEKTGMVKRIISGDVDLPVSQSWGYYTSYDSMLDKSDSQQNSGAYIFRPSKPDQELIPYPPLGAEFVYTPVGMEVHAKFKAPWVRQVTRIVAGQPYVEVEYQIGPIPIDDGRGKEIVTRFDVPIESEGVFYTDSNAREFQRRTRDYRPTWDLSLREPVAGNYYPVNAAIYIEDSNASLAVLVDRSQGGASLADGSIELMVQRRTLADDHRGVDEPLNETTGGVTPYPPYGKAERKGEGVVIRGKHRIMVGKGKSGASLARSEMDGAFAEPLVFVGSGHLSDPIVFRHPSFSGLQAALPANLMLITWMRLPGRPKTTFLLRLGHQYGLDEDDTLSQPVDVDLSTLLAGYSVLQVIEMTLSGNQRWDDYLTRRFDWTGEGFLRSSVLSGTLVTILPMEIRTFEVVVS
jgi:hypothetical protein